MVFYRGKNVLNVKVNYAQIEIVSVFVFQYNTWSKIVHYSYDRVRLRSKLSYTYI